MAATASAAGLLGSLPDAWCLCTAVVALTESDAAATRTAAEAACRASGVATGDAVVVPVAATGGVLDKSHTAVLSRADVVVVAVPSATAEAHSDAALAAWLRAIAAAVSPGTCVVAAVELADAPVAAAALGECAERDAWVLTSDARAAAIEQSLAQTLTTHFGFDAAAAAADMATHRASCVRTGGERGVPLTLWRKPEVQSWVLCQRGAGNRIDDARGLWVFRAGPQRVCFLYAVHFTVYIASEGRHKSNELAVGRADCCSVALVHLPSRREIDGTTTAAVADGMLMDAKVVLVGEFRTPVRNTRSYVLELPGGSSWTRPSEPLPLTDGPLGHGPATHATALEEVHEECGLAMEPHRVYHVATRQIASTLSLHAMHVYAAVLTNDEIAECERRAASGASYGVEADTERTTLHVMRVGELFEPGSGCDWSVLGAVVAAVRDAIARRDNES